MHLSPADRDRLLVFGAAQLAAQRLARGLLLNAPEATALVASAVAEAARDGARIEEAREAGRRVLRPDQVLPGVAGVVRVVHVEAVFDDGTRLVVVDEPFGPPSARGPGWVDAAPPAEGAEGSEPSLRPAGAAAHVVTVTNTAEVPVTVTSHYHFFEVNPRLSFDRAAGYGMRLDVDAGTAVRFDPGETRDVSLVPISGRRVVVGFAGLVDGPLDAPGAKERALEAARACGYLGAGPDGGAGRSTR